MAHYVVNWDFDSVRIFRWTDSHLFEEVSKFYNRWRVGQNGSFRTAKLAGNSANWTNNTWSFTSGILNGEHILGLENLIN